MAEEIAEETAEQKQPYWGPWPTVGLGCGLMAVALALSTLIGIVFLVVELGSHASADIEKVLEGLLTNGLYFSIATIAMAIVCTGLIIVFVNMRHTISFQDYLGLRSLSIKQMLVALAIAAGILFLFDGTSLLLGRPIVGEWQLTLYQSTVWPALMWIAFVVFGPVFEETLFRGFVFEGFRHSGMGVVGAVLVTALLWSLSHIQYNFYGMGQIFIFGIVLGFVRYKTGSLWSVISMHALFNLVATTEVALHISSMN
jgi:membrane protease YdiL (CAAX protease family)